MTNVSACGMRPQAKRTGKNRMKTAGRERGREGGREGGNSHQVDRQTDRQTDRQMGSNNCGRLTTTAGTGQSQSGTSCG